MAHFTRIRAPGFWTYKTSILHTEMETIDANLAKAINGDGGGVYAPTSTIEIGGLGIKITGLAEFTSGIEVTNLALFHNDLSVEGLLYVGGDPALGYKVTITGTTKFIGAISGTDFGFSGDGSVTGNLQITGDTGMGGAREAGFKLKVTGNQKITGNLSVGGAPIVGRVLSVHGAVGIDGTLFATDCSLTDGVFSGDVSVGDDLDVGGDATVGGTLAVTGATTLAGTTTANLHATGDMTVDGVFKGKGPVAGRLFTMTNANATVSVDDYDEVFVPAGVLSATRDVIIDPAGAIPGSRMHVFSADPSHIARVYIPSTGEYIELQYVIGSYIAVDLRFAGGHWRIAGVGKL